MIVIWLLLASFDSHWGGMPHITIEQNLDQYKNTATYPKEKFIDIWMIHIYENKRVTQSS